MRHPYLNHQRNGGEMIHPMKTASRSSGAKRRIPLSILLRAGFGMLALVSVASWAQSSPSSGGDVGLQRVILQMNTAAAAFRSAQADFSWDVYQAVVQDHEVQSGTIYFDRQGGTTLMAAHIQTAGEDDSAKMLVFNGEQLQFYQPAIKQMTIFRAGSNRGEYESYLTLGFGGSGADLQANWDVSLLGMEMMDGIQVAKLDLKPKAENVKNMFTHVTIWVDPTRAISLKQVFYEPSGDQRTDIFSNIKYNQPIKRGVFEIKIPPGTAVQTR